MLQVKIYNLTYLTFRNTFENGINPSIFIKKKNGPDFFQRLNWCYIDMRILSLTVLLFVEYFEIDYYF